MLSRLTSSSLLTQMNPREGNKMNRWKRNRLYLYTSPCWRWASGKQQVVQIKVIPLRSANNHRNLYAPWTHIMFLMQTWQTSLLWDWGSAWDYVVVVAHKQVRAIKHTQGAAKAPQHLGQINHRNSCVHVCWCQSMRCAVVHNLDQKAALHAVVWYNIN